MIGDIVKSNFSSEYCAETIPIDTPPETAISSDKETELEVKGREENEEERGGEKVTGPVRDPDCTECRLVHPDPTPDQLIMYLHALRYTVSCVHIYSTVYCEISYTPPHPPARDLIGTIPLTCHHGQQTQNIILRYSHINNTVCFINSLCSATPPVLYVFWS